MASRKEVEYATLDIGDSAKEKELLNAMGKEGWILVTIVRERNPGSVIEPGSKTAYFMRDK